MKAPITIALEPGTRAVRLERNAAQCRKDGCKRKHDLDWQGGDYPCQDPDECQLEIGSWALWISTPTRDSGTYIKFYDNGKVERVFLHPDGWEETWPIKPEDQ